MQWGVPVLRIPVQRRLPMVDILCPSPQPCVPNLDRDSPLFSWACGEVGIFLNGGAQMARVASRGGGGNLATPPSLEVCVARLFQIWPWITPPGVEGGGGSFYWHWQDPVICIFPAILCPTMGGIIHNEG